MVLIYIGGPWHWQIHLGDPMNQFIVLQSWENWPDLSEQTNKTNILSLIYMYKKVHKHTWLYIIIIFIIILSLRGQVYGYSKWPQICDDIDFGLSFSNETHSNCWYFLDMDVYLKSLCIVLIKATKKLNENPTVRISNGEVVTKIIFPVNLVTKPYEKHSSMKNCYLWYKMKWSNNKKDTLNTYQYQT